MVKSRKFLYAKAFEGEPRLDNFELVEEELAPLKDGEILLEAQCWSVDPYMRPYMRGVSTGGTMIGSQVAKITESKNAKYSVGQLVVVYVGWRTLTIINPDEVKGPAILSAKPVPVPDLGNLPTSLALGCLGMPGNTAYFGFLEICQPKAGETVVVSGAAGAVGSIVGQIAKIKGCTVIGFAGSDDKVKWLVDDLGFDYAYNYKTNNISDSLQKAAPNGVDCYFDNVGGEMSSSILKHMNLFGRISLCGAISIYNDNEPPKVSAIQGSMVFKQLKMEGFVVSRWANRWMEGLEQLKKWTQEGKIKYKETYVQGFDKMPEAFIGLMKGKNTGKMIVNP